MARLRRRTGTREYLMNQPHLVVFEPSQYKGRWRELFQNDHPIYVELGMGKGKFIIEMSRKYPEVNFIGIDMYDELLRKACEQFYAYAQQEEGGQAISNPNLRFVLQNIEYIEDIFAENEVDRIFLNFSDPWPKKRHAHRRLTHPNFLNKYRTILNHGGEIHLKTDSRSFFEFSLNQFADMGWEMRNISLDLHANGTPEDHVFTEYELKFVEQGMSIYRCEVVNNK